MSRHEYHTIPGTAITGTYDTEALWEQFNVGDVAGLTVLDLGCAAGGWSILAARKGAKEVIAVDHGLPPWLQHDAAEAGVSVSLVQGDATNPTLLVDHQFDLVLCLSLLHGVDHPLQLIRNLGRWTSKRALVECEVACGTRRACDVTEVFETRGDAYTDISSDPPASGLFLAENAVVAAIESIGLVVDRIVPGRKRGRLLFDTSRSRLGSR